ncbi:MAG TPA: phosphotransferase [Gaiellaceae bacterium]|nr:phosphotransferase [Gaiellaceae bacterium]
MRAAGTTAVLKLLRLNAGPHPRWLSERDRTSAFWWLREPVAYESGVLEPFGVPRVLARVDRPNGDVALWLEDGGGEIVATPAALGEVAERLGDAQRRLVGVDEAWLAHGFLDEYLRLHDAKAADRRLAELPQTVCHNDFHPANVLDRGVVIDWAYCGVGAAGLDAGVLVVDGLADGAYPAEQADDVAVAVWQGYRRGFGEDVRLGFLEGARRLRWLPRGRKPEWDATLDLIERLASTV